MNTFSENGNGFVGRLLHEGGVWRRTFLGFSQNQNLRSLNLFFCVSFFPSHDSLVFVSYETRVIIILRDKRTLKKCVVCSNRGERALFSCVFLYPPFQQAKPQNTSRRDPQIHPSTHTSIIIIIVYTHIEEEEDISSSSSWRWYHHHRRRA